MNRKYTKELLSPIVKKSRSIRQVILALGLKETGGNYSHIAKTIDKLGLDRSHFVGQGHNKGKQANNRYPTKHYLNDQNFLASHKLRKRLLHEGYFPHKCQLCNQEEWFDQPIPLELHHMDCNPYNNHLDNLRMLCPNCHKYAHDQ